MSKAKTGLPSSKQKQNPQLELQNYRWLQKWNWSWSRNWSRNQRRRQDTRDASDITLLIKDLFKCNLHQLHHSSLYWNSRTWRRMKACNTRWDSKSRSSQDCWSSRLACLVRNRNSSWPSPLRSLPSLWRSQPTCLPRRRRIPRSLHWNSRIPAWLSIGRYLKRILFEEESNSHIKNEH